MNERNWRVVFGAIALGCTLAVAQPPVQASPILTAILVVVAGVAGFLKAPDDAVTYAVHLLAPALLAVVVVGLLLYAYSRDEDDRMRPR